MSSEKSVNDIYDLFLRSFARSTDLQIQMLQSFHRLESSMASRVEQQKAAANTAKSYTVTEIVEPEASYKLTAAKNVNTKTRSTLMFDGSNTAESSASLKFTNITTKTNPAPNVIESIIIWPRHQKVLNNHQQHRPTTTNFKVMASKSLQATWDSPQD